VPYHVSKQRFSELVERALEGLPQPFADHVEEISVEIKDRPTRKQLHDLGMEEDELMLGLYVGSPFIDRSVLHSGQLPDRIFIFQEDVELASDSEADLVEQVRVTVLHELGHHFGMDEDQLDELGYG
jgi:predicted Zn-dependent protease with MMP-like domain